MALSSTKAATLDWHPLENNDAMASSVPDVAVVAEAERLVSILKSHTGSPADQAKAVRQLEKLRCLLHTGSDALMFQALPVCWL